VKEINHTFKGIQNNRCNDGVKIYGFFCFKFKDKGEIDLCRPISGYTKHYIPFTIVNGNV